MCWRAWGWCRGMTMTTTPVYLPAQPLAPGGLGYPIPNDRDAITVIQLVKAVLDDFCGRHGLLSTTLARRAEQHRPLPENEFACHGHTVFIEDTGEAPRLFILGPLGVWYCYLQELGRRFFNVHPVYAGNVDLPYLRHGRAYQRTLHALRVQAVTESQHDPALRFIVHFAPRDKDPFLKLYDGPAMQGVSLKQNGLPEDGGVILDVYRGGQRYTHRYFAERA